MRSCGAACTINKMFSKHCVHCKFKSNTHQSNSLSSVLWLNANKDPVSPLTFSDWETM